MLTCQRGRIVCLGWVICLLALMPLHYAWAGTDGLLTGDWGGLRNEMMDRGIDLGAAYQSEFAANFKGGDTHRQTYASELSLRGDFDLSVLAGWGGATLRIKFTHRDGDGLNDHAQLNELMQSQPVYGRGAITRLSLLYLQQELFNDRLTVKLGRLNVGDEFGDFPCEFMLLSFCGSQLGNVQGNTIYNNPVSQWAATVHYDLTPSLYLAVGAYQVNPSWLRDGQALSLTGTHGTVGMLVPVELGWQVTPFGLPGRYKLGGWYDSAGGDDLFENTEGSPLLVDGGEPRRRSRERGVYFNAVQQLLAREPGSARGLNAEIYWIHADPHVALIEQQLSVALVYHGPFDRRPQDMVGLGRAWTSVNHRVARGERLYNDRLPADGETLAVQGDEQGYALFYRVQLLGSVAMTPEVQYVRHPSGSDRNDDDVVFGFRTAITF